MSNIEMQLEKDTFADGIELVFAETERVIASIASEVSVERAMPSA